MNRLLVPAAIIALANVAGAQSRCGQEGPPTPANVGGAMIGLVTDEQNLPLERVSIIIAKPRREAATNATGRFSIADLPPGTYPIIVRRIGFAPATISVEHGPEGSSLRICMEEEIHSLSPIVTSIARGGISGIVGDSIYRMLPDVEVRVLGEGKVARTDTAGGFFLDVEKGSYGLQITKKGYARRIISVSVPPDSGRRIAVWLSPSNPGYERRRAKAFDDMKWRVALNGTSKTMVSSEDLAKTNMDLEQFIRLRANACLTDSTEVTVDGEYRAPLWSIAKSEIELMEVYPARFRSARGPTQIRGAGRAPAAPPSCAAQVIVWLKR